MADDDTPPGSFRVPAASLGWATSSDEKLGALDLDQAAAWGVVEQPPARRVVQLDVRTLTSILMVIVGVIIALGTAWAVDPLLFAAALATTLIAFGLLLGYEKS